MNSQLDYKTSVYISKPSHDFLVLRESAKSVQEVGRKGKEAKGGEHLQVGFVGDVVELEVDHLAEVGEEIRGEDEADDQGDYEELKVSKLGRCYLEFLMRLSMCGSPPWLTMKTTDCEIAEKSKMTVFTKERWNSTSALMFLSSAGK